MKFIRETVYFDEINNEEIIKREFKLGRTTSFDKKYYFFYFANLVQVLSQLANVEFDLLTCISGHNGLEANSPKNLEFAFNDIKDYSFADMAFINFRNCGGNVVAYVIKGILEGKEFTIRINLRKRKISFYTNTKNPANLEDLEVYTLALEKSLAKCEEGTL